MFRVNVTDPSTALTEFDRLVSSIIDDDGLYAIAKKYDDDCRKKYQAKMSRAITWTCGGLEERGIDTIVQSSFSADVYVDDPGNVDVDVVIPVGGDGQAVMEEAEKALKEMGFMFSEDRNADLKRYIHRVYTFEFDGIIVEAKIRDWKDYQQHLFRIHSFLDALPKKVRVAWRYIRGRVRDSPSSVSKPIKFLWYMVGAIKTNVDMKDYPMNIFY